MSNLEEAKSIFNSLVEVIKTFKSPTYKSFFLKKADEDFNELHRQIQNGKNKCVINPYINKQKDLLDVLKRQTVIYNMYYDENSNI
ncbi:hypothetical protein H311_01270 [Anncaliia algerae PRA109]|nr:hypothetical protein H311_01270 [Anncaliia algerae PRA109]